jgi:HEAT repeat protein
MRRTWFVAFGVMVALQVAGAAAWARPASREAVRSVLRARDAIRMTAADWQRLGDDVDVYLAEAAADKSLVYGARQRALGGLGAVRGERAKEFLHRFVTEREVPGPLLASAFQAYARGFSSEDSVEVQRLGVELLAHPDWLVRQSAVRALGRLGGEEAHAALRAHQAKESHPAVLAAVRGALAGGPKAR